MRDVIRIVLFAVIVAGIALTIAPPVGTSASAGRKQAERQVIGPSEDLPGTYAGTITPEAAGEMPDSGVIVVGRAGQQWTASAGPDVDTQFPAERVTPTARGLTFDVSLPGDVVRVLSFDLSVDGARMDGTVSLLRDGVRTTGRVAFARQ